VIANALLDLSQYLNSHKQVVEVPFDNSLSRHLVAQCEVSVKKEEVANVNVDSNANQSARTTQVLRKTISPKHPSLKQQNSERHKTSSASSQQRKIKAMLPKSTTSQPVQQQQPKQSKSSIQQQQQIH